MAKSPVNAAREELAQIEKRREELMSGIRGSAESELKNALREFNALGLGVTYELRAVGRGSRRGTRSVDPNRPCPICGFKTIPPHDARAHRAQGNKKKAFTAEELSAKGLAKA
jgi:hypothetical protein